MISSRVVMALATMLVVQGDAWAPARPDYEWSFPQDHWAHPDYRVEWWYFTGHLESSAQPTRRFGYQFTVFRIGLTRRPPTCSGSRTS